MGTSLRGRGALQGINLHGRLRHRTVDDRHHHRGRRLFLAAERDRQRSVSLSEHSLVCRGYEFSAGRFKDAKLYTKYAWVAYLQQKYGTIAKLNAAWNSNYTTFGDSGGFGVGTGVLDEDGRHKWMGTDP